MNLVTFLHNNQGQNSSVRLILFLYSIAMLAVWVFASIKSNPVAMATFPDTSLYVLGMIFGAKSWEKFVENKECKPEERKE